MATAAPVLSTPAERNFEEPTPVVVQSSSDQLSDEQLYIQYEITRTLDEIRAGNWRRIALQFPDDMLVHAPRVFEHLQRGLRHTSNRDQTLESADPERPNEDQTKITPSASHSDVSLCILADTSYGACCVDEVAAEHVNADVVIHYGRACLSPTARLPVIYVYTTKSLDLDKAVEGFEQTYADKAAPVCLMADVPYSHHVKNLTERLSSNGYTNLFATGVIRDPSSALPNRTVPDACKADPDKLKDYSIWHIASPPTSLLLTLSSRVNKVHIYEPRGASPDADNQSTEIATNQILRRRYALITKLATVPIFGILINTLSVSNYMQALQHCQELIKAAGKKSYVFVVGKVNAAKVANFSEIGGWVVIGCWESSLIESKDFYRPLITPFELEIALTEDSNRTWTGEWISDFGSLLGRPAREENLVSSNTADATLTERSNGDANTTSAAGNWDDQSDDEPPEFDLRTGRYVSHSRPLAKERPDRTTTDESRAHADQRPLGSALVRRAEGQVMINGTVSPAAEYLRSQRTWQGLGSDYEIAYERDENGNIRGATMEEGRAGVAKGYTVGDDSLTS